MSRAKNGMYILANFEALQRLTQTGVHSELQAFLLQKEECMAEVLGDVLIGGKGSGVHCRQE